MVAVDSQSLKTHRALVVEDNEHAACLLEFLLERAGFDVTVARNGRDAAAVIDNLPRVDVVVLDLLLPYVSGFQLLGMLREDREWMQVPVIVVSAKVLEEDIVQALDLGANDYVTKPYRPKELLARIRRLIADREEMAQG